MTPETMESTMAGTGRSLARHGIEPTGDVHWNLSPARLYEETLARGDGQIAHMGAISVVTAPHTGRSPNDRFVVRDEHSESTVDWGNLSLHHEWTRMMGFIVLLFFALAVYFVQRMK